MPTREEQHAYTVLTGSETIVTQDDWRNMAKRLNWHKPATKTPDAWRKQWDRIRDNLVEWGFICHAGDGRKALWWEAPSRLKSPIEAAGSNVFKLDFLG